jgi:hypothetical protein
VAARGALQLSYKGLTNISTKSNPPHWLLAAGIQLLKAASAA